MPFVSFAMVESLAAELRSKRKSVIKSETTDGRMKHFGLLKAGQTDPIFDATCCNRLAILLHDVG